MSDEKPDCIHSAVILETVWTNCPPEVKEQIRDIWRNYELGNDYYYFSWDSEQMKEEYPIIHAYLTGRNITKCLIHFWW